MIISKYGIKIHLKNRKIEKTKNQFYFILFYFKILFYFFFLKNKESNWIIQNDKKTLFH